MISLWNLCQLYSPDLAIIQTLCTTAQPVALAAGVPRRNLMCWVHNNRFMQDYCHDSLGWLSCCRHSKNQLNSNSLKAVSLTMGTFGLLDLLKVNSTQIYKKQSPLLHFKKYHTMTQTFKHQLDHKTPHNHEQIK